TTGQRPAGAVTEFRHHVIGPPSPAPHQRAPGGPCSFSLCAFFEGNQRRTRPARKRTREGEREACQEVRIKNVVPFPITSLNSVPRRAPHGGWQRRRSRFSRRNCNGF